MLGVKIREQNLFCTKVPAGLINVSDSYCPSQRQRDTEPDNVVQLSDLNVAESSGISKSQRMEDNARVPELIIDCLAA